MDAWVVSVVTIVTSLVGSSGLWAYLQRRDTRKDATTQLLLGIAHDRIIFLGMSYIDKGWISKDEYDDLMKYLYEPYTHFGGNGLAEKIMNEVKQLPIRGANHPHLKVIRERHAE